MKCDKITNRLVRPEHAVFLILFLRFNIILAYVYAFINKILYLHYDSRKLGAFAVSGAANAAARWQRFAGGAMVLALPLPA